MVSRRRILGFAIGKMLRQDGWAEKYNPKNQFHVNQYDYSSCKEYLAALKEKWQEYEDPECEFEDYVNVSKYSNYDDYACDVVEYKSRLEWRDQWDCDREFDFNPCDFEYEEYYVKALKRAWKKEYDPYNEFAHVDLEWVNDVNEYRNRIDECREWKDEHDPNDEYHVDPSQFDDEEEYVDELRGLWKRKYDYFNEFSSIDPQDYRDEYTYSGAIEDKKYWMNKCDKNNAYKLDPSDCDGEEEYLDALRSCWQDKYDPSFKTNIDVDDYDTEEDYRNALILDWQETFDSKHQFNGFNFDKFTTIDDYLVEYNDRLNWIKECDSEGMYSKIDASNYDNLIQYKHQINLRKAWKNKYDPNNEHTNIDPCNYSSVEEYQGAIMDFDIRSTKL